MTRPSASLGHCGIEIDRSVAEAHYLPNTTCAALLLVHALPGERDEAQRADEEYLNERCRVHNVRRDRIGGFGR
jgi:hypothetical protein